MVRQEPVIVAEMRRDAVHQLGDLVLLPEAAGTADQAIRVGGNRDAVLSELVSEPKFPASWEYTGYFVRRGPPSGLLARNPEPNSTIYEPIPYASEQGIYFGLAGN
jgi:hypothetical protein